MNNDLKIYLKRPFKVDDTGSPDEKLKFNHSNKSQTPSKPKKLRNINSVKKENLQCQNHSHRVYHYIWMNKFL